jgi:hypothetical protein
VESKAAPLPPLHLDNAQARVAIIEAKGCPKLLGFQFHPVRFVANDVEDALLLEMNDYVHPKARRVLCHHARVGVF